jgi:DNA polymerase/3'-5' exonuclease PolX
MRPCHNPDPFLSSCSAQLFSDRIAEAGGQVESEFGGRKDTFVIADASVSSFAEVWGSHGAPARILKDAWLSKCLQQKQLVPPEDGEEIIVVSSTDQKDVAGQTAKGCQQLQQGLTSDVASKFSWLKKKGGGETAPRRLSFACQKSGTKELLKPSPNKVICDIYTELAGLLKSCPLKASDVWGAKNRSKVAAALGLLDQPVTCGADAASAVKGCGPKLQTEINEIIMTGKLELLENVRANPKVTAIRELTSIHGVGSKTALSLYERGFQSVASLRTDRGQEILTWQQKIGVEYYEDIQQRIPRTEVKEILERVRLEAEKLCPGVDCEAMGSFRRGKESCGDVDILISPPPGQENCNVLRALLESLRTAGFISADLNHPHEHVPGKSESWMGICRLGPDRLHRRVDIKVYPRSQLAYARLYFTGSDHFNRSMRHYARHVLSMTLSDRHLASCMIKNGVREWIGPSFDCETEKDVFDRMGLEYRKPTERNVYESFVAGLSDDEDEEEAGGIVAAAAGAGEEEEGK